MQQRSAGYALKVWAVCASAVTLMLAWHVPAVAEAGLKGYETSTWHGILAPASTPPDIVVKLNAEIARILAQPAVKERLLGQGLDPVGGTPEQFATYLKAEVSKWPAS